MSRAILGAFLLLLASCAALTLPVSPGQVADNTVADELAAIGLNNSYQAATALLRLANRAGELDASDRQRWREVDKRAIAQVRRAKRAYELGNADDLRLAKDAAEPLITELFGLGPKQESNRED